MKLKIKQVSTIPKKLVLLSITFFLFLAVAFTSSVFANENTKIAVETGEGDTYLLDAGFYAIYAGQQDYTNIYTASNFNDNSGQLMFGTDMGIWFELKYSVVFKTGEGDTYLLDAGFYAAYTGQQDYVNIYDATGFHDNTGKVIFGTDMGIWFENKTIDNKSPVVSGETTFVSNVADPKDASYFMQFLSAYDETDGDVTSSLKIIQDNYTANKSKLGNHTFTVEASDNSGNKTTAIINVRVVDIDKPVITGNSTTATIGYKETYNIENFRKTLNVSDNYDQMTNADIKLKSDNYTANKTKLGTYTVVFHAKDKSGNEGTFSKDIKVIDNVKPTFSGPSVISTSNNTILTEAEIRAQITAHDDIDGNITNRIELVEDNYTGNGNKVGSYNIRYSVKDNANNIEYFNVDIQRTDKIPPSIWVEDGVSIRTNIDTPISYDIIIDILQATGQIKVNASTTFSFPLDEYTGNESEPGIYAMSVKARSTDGNESIFNLSIVVLDTEDDGGIDVNPDFSFPVFLKDNWYWFAIGAVGLIGVVAISTRKRR